MLSFVPGMGKLIKNGQALAESAVAKAVLKAADRVDLDSRPSEQDLDGLTYHDRTNGSTASLNSDTSGSTSSGSSSGNSSGGAGSKVASLAVNHDDLPSLSILMIASSLIKLNSRTRILKDLQYQVARFLSWKQPAFTISLLIIYTVICMRPYLLVAVPSLILLMGSLVPGYDQRHPGKYVALLPRDSPRHRQKSEFDELADYTPRLEPPLLDESEKDIMLLLRKLQRGLVKAVEGLEKLDLFLATTGNFTKEYEATALFFVIVLGLPPAIYGASIAYSLVNPNLAAAAAGWALVATQHPNLQPPIHKMKKDYEDYFEENELILAVAMRRLTQKEVVIDDPPESSTVEIFELQRQGLTPRHYDSWLFTPAIYGSNSPFRISQQRPPGTRFLEDVSAPKGWYFDDAIGWELDTNTKEWALLRGVRDIEIDVDDHWAYDAVDGNPGEWRRRRWTRKCFKPAVPKRETVQELKELDESIEAGQAELEAAAAISAKSEHAPPPQAIPL